MTMLDDFWATQEECLDALAACADSADAVIDLLNTYYAPSSADAFFPGGGDRNVLDVLMHERDDWRYLWSEASYHYAVINRVTGQALTFVEGDVYRGNVR